MIKFKLVNYELKLYSPESTDIFVTDKDFVALLSGLWTIILFHNYRTLATAVSYHPTHHSTKHHKSPETGSSLHNNIGK